MEENRTDMTPEEVAELQPDTYRPRPKWQIVAAWVGIAIVAVGFLLYCYHIATGGM